MLSPVVSLCNNINGLINQLQPTIWQKITKNPVSFESKQEIIQAISTQIFSLQQFQFDEATKKSIDALESEIAECTPNKFNPEQIKDLWKPIKNKIKRLDVTAIKPKPKPKLILEPRPKLVLESITAAMARVGVQKEVDDNEEPGSQPETQAGERSVIEQEEKAQGRQGEAPSFADLNSYIAKLTPIVLRDSMVFDTDPNRQYGGLLYEVLYPIFIKDERYEKEVKALFICKEQGWISQLQIASLKALVLEWQKITEKGT